MNPNEPTGNQQKTDDRVLLVQQLFVSEISSLRGMLWGLVPDHHRLDDIVQETFLTVTRKASDFEPGTNFRAWLHAIARFKVLHSLRQNPLEHSLSVDLIETMLEESSEPEHFDERLAYLRSCMNHLGSNARLMLKLRYEDGLSIADVADRLGRRVNSIKVMLSRTRSTLRECIDKKQIAHRVPS